MPSLNHAEVARFFACGGETKLRYDYPLNECSLIIDLGGYVGDFSKRMYEKYNCNIEIYEPIEALYNTCVNKFNGIDKIKVFKLGVTNSCGYTTINLMEDGSTIFGNSNKYETIQLIDILKVIDGRTIDLLKINVEGPEYEIMEAIINNNLCRNVKNFQIQFHDFDYIKSPIERRDFIRSVLQTTHEITYDFPFVWENWKLK